MQWANGTRNPKTTVYASIDHHNCTLGKKCHPWLHGSCQRRHWHFRQGLANWWHAHTHIYTSRMYYVTLLPCVLKTEDMTAATANHLLPSSSSSLPFRKIRGNCEWQSHWYLLNRYQYLGLSNLHSTRKCMLSTCYGQLNRIRAHCIPQLPLTTKPDWAHVHVCSKAMHNCLFFRLI